MDEVENEVKLFLMELTNHSTSDRGHLRNIKLAVKILNSHIKGAEDELGIQRPKLNSNKSKKPLLRTNKH
jgi:hypothetical protein